MGQGLLLPSYSGFEQSQLQLGFTVAETRKRPQKGWSSNGFFVQCEVTSHQILSKRILPALAVNLVSSGTASETVRAERKFFVTLRAKPL
jgi:hypothetical protein